MHMRPSPPFQFVSLKSVNCFGHRSILRSCPQSHRWTVTPHLRRCYASGKGSKLPPPSSASSASRSSPAPPKKLIPPKRHELNRLLKTTKDGRVELYDPRTHGSYTFVVWATATLCFLYAAINAQLVFVDKVEKRSRKEKIFWGSLCSIMVAGGALALRRGNKVITGMSLVEALGEPRIEIKVRTVVPFRKERRILATPEQITYYYRTIRRSRRSDEEKTKAKSMVNSGVGMDVIEAARQKMDISFFKNPGRKVSLMIWQLGESLKLLFNPNGFARLSIAGREKDLKYPMGGLHSAEYVLLAPMLKAKIGQDFLSRLLRWFTL